MANSWNQPLGYRKVVAVTPDDVTRYSGFQALYTGAGGDLSLIVGDSTITVTAAPAGVTIPLAASAVLAATTATGVLLFGY
jgi:hypothetical protein